MIGNVIAGGLGVLVGLTIWKRLDRQPMWRDDGCGSLDDDELALWRARRDHPSAGDLKMPEQVRRDLFGVRDE